MTEAITVSHINVAQPAQTHPPMYFMHKYWARKPHNVVAKYIETYSGEGEIVLDPFSGSGVTSIESLRLKRKTVAVDLDPMAAFITHVTIVPVDLGKFEAAFRQIESKVKAKILRLYETECKRCHGTAVVSHVVWKQKTEKRLGDESPLEIWYHCSCKKDIQNKKPSPTDLRFLKRVNTRKIPFWIPKGELIWNTRINVHKGTKVPDLFTRRNLIALSIIFNEIDSLQDAAVRDLMRFVFTGFVIKSSRLNFVNVGGYSSLGRGWAVRGYWVPPEHMEQNVWNDFEGQFNDVLKGKREAQQALGSPREANSFDELSHDRDFLTRNQTATDLSFIPNDSVDYIFTDPPYADSVPYLELHYLWSQWLRFNVKFDDEIVMSDSPVRREKNFGDYERLINITFRLLYDKLKANHWMTVTFHNSKIYIYNAIIKAAVLAGFDLERIIYQPPAKPSAKGLLHPYGTAVGDYYIRFFKPAKSSAPLSTEEIDHERYERIVVNAVTDLIAHRGEPTPYTFILNSYADIYAELKREGYLFSAPESIEDILKRNLGKNFILKENKWWFKDASKVPFIERVPLSERVEETVINILNREPKVSYDKIIETLFLTFPNALTPETRSVREILEEYAKKTPDGKWMLKPAVKRRIEQHDVIVELVSKVGEALGYKVIADIPERRVATLPFESENPDRVKEIDAIWLDDSKPVYEFEIEHSTGFSLGIDRGSNLRIDGVKRVFVTPEERKELLNRKFREKKFSQEIQEYNWRFLYYSDIEQLYELSKTRKGLTIADVEEKIKLPSEVRVEKQSNLDGFR